VRSFGLAELTVVEQVGGCLCALIRLGGRSEGREKRVGCLRKQENQRQMSYLWALLVRLGHFCSAGLVRTFG
jgi:hypothetical protein